MSWLHIVMDGWGDLVDVSRGTMKGDGSFWREKYHGGGREMNLYNSEGEMDER